MVWWLVTADSLTQHQTDRLAVSEASPVAWTWPVASVSMTLVQLALEESPARTAVVFGVFSLLWLSVTWASATGCPAGSATADRHLRPVVGHRRR